MVMGNSTCRVSASLQTQSRRLRVYGLLIGFLFALAWLTLGAKSIKNHEAMDFVVSDGEGYWVYLPSLVIDRNLRFTRSVEFHETVHPIDSTTFSPTPYGLRNRYPCGVALTLAPAFMLAHGTAMLLYHWVKSPCMAPNGYSFPYQFLCLCEVMLLGWLTLAAADELLTRQFKLDGVSTGAAIVVYALGSSWAYYIFREPFMSHGIAAAWVMFTILLASRICTAANEGGLVWWWWPAMSFAFAMAVTCRLIDVVLLAVPLWALFVSIRQGLLPRIVRLLPLILAAAFPLALELWVLHIMASRNAGTGVGNAGYRRFEIFNWTRPRLLNTLFSTNHGLFVFAPVLLFSMWGYASYLVIPRRRLDGLVLAMLLTVVTAWYVDSAWWDWWFGKAFGQRPLVDFSAVFIVGLGFCFGTLGPSLGQWPRIAKLAIAGAVAVNGLLLVLFIGQKIPREGPIFGKDIHVGLEGISPTN